MASNSDTGGGQHRFDCAVAASSERAEVGRDAYRLRADRRTDLRNALLRTSSGDEQSTVERVVHRPQRVAEELQPPGSGGRFQARIEDEAPQHLGVGFGGLQQWRKVVQS